MLPPTPLSTDLVLLGGGHTHALVLRKWGMAPLPGVRLTLITDLADTPYSGMLPSHVAGVYNFDEAHIDLRPLTRFANCRLVMDRAIGLDLANQRVLCANHPPSPLMCSPSIRAARRRPSPSPVPPSMLSLPNPYRSCCASGKTFWRKFRPSRNSLVPSPLWAVAWAA